MIRRPKKTLRDLTWTDLEKWAGTTIVARGMSYQKSGRVNDLTTADDGGILAWVQGSGNYAVKASFDKGRLSSACTCPYDGACKHAVAAILEYLERLKKKAAVPSADEDDERILLLEDESATWEDEEDCVDFTEDESDELIEEAEHALTGTDASLKKKSASFPESGCFGSGEVKRRA